MSGAQRGAAHSPFTRTATGTAKASRHRCRRLHSAREGPEKCRARAQINNEHMRLVQEENNVILQKLLAHVSV